MTLRDSDETRLLARLEALLQRFPQQGAVSRVVMPSSQPGPEWCGIHGVTMRRTEKDGQAWYSHKVEDGWCKGKPRKASR